MKDDMISRQAAIDALIEWYGCEPADIGAFENIIEKMPSAQPESQWIPCSERLPEEKQSIFAKYKGTAKWQKSFWEKQSDIVLVAIACKDGYKFVTTARTVDAVWKCDHLAIRGSKVIAWQPLPEPPEE